ncbi:SGNH/GDSL hydrolase family protein [Aromatoleum toluclasticum]|uniref:SGNH/GDSL hydrolase family protein n=1 Tax=Aromatoleum toluclasticum TaxID=92003 RepID=UPI000477E9FD|nr:SGNH/GDSL hydrolase family protein [Aromatoleum toluclasticum]
MKNKLGTWTRLLSAALVLALPGFASAQLEFSNVVVFGTSISDPGNGFALLTHPVEGLNLDSTVPQTTPPHYEGLDETLVPSAPYAKGGHHLSNGPTWIEQYAVGHGFARDVGPAFQDRGKASNYAVAGARAVDFPGRVNLPDQVQVFLQDVGNNAPADALYAVEIGSNDVRDALVAFASTLQDTHDLAQATEAAQAVISNALNSIASHMQTLYFVGARKFLVVNAPRLDLVPAVRFVEQFVPGTATLAFSLTQAFNQALSQNVLDPLAGLPDIQIARMDIATQMTTIVTAPSSFALTNVTDPCVTPNVPPYTCLQPDSYFFWDGIHPTKAVHGIFAQQAAGILTRYPAP